jgi:hypothetical protein
MRLRRGAFRSDGANDSLHEIIGGFKLWIAKAGYLSFTNISSSLQAVVEPSRYMQLFGAAIVFFIQFCPKIPTVAFLFH